MNLAFRIRPATSTDYGFVIDSCRKELGHMFKDEWSGKARQVLTPALDGLVRESDIAIAADESTDAILGWAMARKGALLFVYVSAHCRKQGIATKLRETLE